MEEEFKTYIVVLSICSSDLQSQIVSRLLENVLLDGNGVSDRNTDEVERGGVEPERQNNRDDIMLDSRAREDILGEERFVSNKLSHDVVNRTSFRKVIRLKHVVINLGNGDVLLGKLMFHVKRHGTGLGCLVKRGHDT